MIKIIIKKNLPMIKRPYLKTRIIVMEVLTCLSLGLELATLIYQLILGFTGFDITQTRYTSCSTTYLNQKLALIKYIFSASLVMLCISLLIVIFLVVFLLVGLIRFFNRDKEIQKNHQLSSKAEDLYDEFFTYGKLVMMYVMFSLAIMTNLVHFGYFVAYLIQYANCEGITLTSVIVLSALSGASTLIVLTNWIILQIILSKVREYLEENKVVTSPIPVWMSSVEKKYQVQNDKIQQMTEIRNSKLDKSKPKDTKVPLLVPVAVGKQGKMASPTEKSSSYKPTPKFYEMKNDQHEYPSEEKPLQTKKKMSFLNYINNQSSPESKHSQKQQQVPFFKSKKKQINEQKHNSSPLDQWQEADKKRNSPKKNQYEDWGQPAFQLKRTSNFSRTISKKKLKEEENAFLQDNSHRSILDSGDGVEKRERKNVHQVKESSRLIDAIRSKYAD